MTTTRTATQRKNPSTKEVVKNPRLDTYPFRLKKNVPGAILCACLAFAGFAAPVSAQAATIEGLVVGVADGDTLTVLRDREQIRIRLAEIDAPEKAQPFGQRSKQSLSDLCYQKQAKIEDHGQDRYGRTIGRVFCNGIDANAEQIRRGLAWVYRQYSKDPSLYPLETEAKAARRGLWADAEPIGGVSENGKNRTLSLRRDC